MSTLSRPYQIYNDIDGRPLTNGYIYVGTYGNDAELSPTNVYRDAALTQVATQPIRTANGYAIYNLSITGLYVSGNVSVKIKNKSGTTLFSGNITPDASSGGDVGAPDINTIVYQFPTSSVNQALDDRMDFEVYPEDFGAVGNGTTDDTAALRLWAAYPSSNHKLTYGKTYLVAPLSVGTIILPISKGMNINGNKATIKVKNSSGQYKAIIGDDTGADLSGLNLYDITFDHNSTNNTFTVTGNVLDNPHCTIYMQRGNKIRLRNLDIQSPVCTNSIAILQNQINYINGVTIENCNWDSVGSTLVQDHSTIYANANHVMIKGCYASARMTMPANGASCFIETHSSYQKVVECSCENYVGFANITGVAFEDSQNIVVSNNTALVSQFGIRLFSLVYTGHTTGYGIKGATINNNTFRIKQEYTGIASSAWAFGIGWQPSATLPIANVTIANNILEYTLETSQQAYTSTFPAIGGIYSSAAITHENIRIIGNTIINPPFSGIALGSSAAEQGSYKNCIIQNNTIINPGQCVRAGISENNQSGVQLYAASFLESILIDRIDIIDNQTTSKITFGVYIISASNSNACDIECTDIRVRATGTTITSLLSVIKAPVNTIPFVTGSINKSPSLLITNYYRYGSEIINVAATPNVKWQLTNPVSSPTNQTWTNERHSTAPPAVNEGWTNRQGSKVWNITPATNVPLGWVCTIDGAPGTWRAFGTAT